MLMPAYSKITHRSEIIRRAHRIRRKHLLKELKRFIGRNYVSPYSALPARMIQLPSEQELCEYW